MKKIRLNCQCQKKEKCSAPLPRMSLEKRNFVNAHVIPEERVHKVAGILAAHNVLRDMHINCEPLTWDEELAQYAEMYAEESKGKKNQESPGGCFMEHNPKNKIYGENLAWLRTFEDSWRKPLGEPEAEASDICQGWYDERSFYEKLDPKTRQKVGFVDHKTAQCLDDDICCVGSRQSGHYTQLISTNSKKMGAAVRVCHWVDSDGTKVKDELWVVMYSPAGNYKNCKTWNKNGTCDPDNLYFMYNYIPEPKNTFWKEEPSWVIHQDKLVASEEYFIEVD